MTCRDLLWMFEVHYIHRFILLKKKCLVSYFQQWWQTSYFKDVTNSCGLVFSARVWTCWMVIWPQPDWWQSSPQRGSTPQTWLAVWMRRCSCVCTSWLSLLSCSSLFYDLFSVTDCGVDHIPGIFRSAIRMCWDIPKSFWRPWWTSTVQLSYSDEGKLPHTHPTGQLLSLPIHLFPHLFFFVTLQMLMMTLEFLFFIRLYGYIFV